MLLKVDIQSTAAKKTHVLPPWFSPITIRGTFSVLITGPGWYQLSSKVGLQALNSTVQSPKEGELFFSYLVAWVNVAGSRGIDFTNVDTHGVAVVSRHSLLNNLIFSSNSVGQRYEYVGFYTSL